MYSTDDFQFSYCKSASEFGTVSQQIIKLLLKDKSRVEWRSADQVKILSRDTLSSFSGLLSYRKPGESNFTKSQQNLQPYMKLLSSEI